METTLSYLNIYISGYNQVYKYIIICKHNSNHWATSVAVRFIYGALSVGLKYFK